MRQFVKVCLVVCMCWLAALAWTVIVLWLVVAWVFPDEAMAAVDVQNAGRNVGETLRTWATALFGGGAAIGAVYYLLSRKIGPAVVFFALAMLVGGFVFAPGTVGELSEGIWKTALR